MLLDARGNPTSSGNLEAASGSDLGRLSPSLLREALEEIAREVAATGWTATDWSIVRDEIGWTQINSTTGGGIADGQRKSVVRRARTYFDTDAASKQIVRLWTNFGIHRGISAKATSDVGKKILRTFWKGRHNRSVFSYWGQRRSSDSLLVDGELALAIGWPDSKRGLKVRRMDPLQISRIITDPEDASVVWYYRREFRVNSDNDERKYCYQDIYAPPDTPPPGEIEDLEDYKYQEDAKVYFVPWDSIGLRGNSLLTTSLDWTKAHRKFMEARTAIERALAKFAWRHKIKGGASAVAAKIAELQSSLVTQTTESNPPPAPGSDWVENLGYDLTPIKVDTGAGNAQIDGAMLIMMVGLGPGVFPQYLGSGESFRLATATAMESPMLKQFESYQELWKTIYLELLDYALDPDVETRGIVEDEPGEFEVEVPPILNRDVPRTIAALAKMLGQIPELANTDGVREWLLTQLGVEDPGVVMDQVRKLEKKKEREAAKRPPIMPAPGGPPQPGETPQGKQAGVLAAIEGLQALEDALMVTADAE
jgi:hypothetical protein